MAYVKEHPPSEVYHLTKKENLNSILEDGMIRRFSDMECWFCVDLQKMKAYMERTVMCEGKPYYSVAGQLCRYPQFVPEDYVLLKLTPCRQEDSWYRWEQEIPAGSPAELVRAAHEFSALKIGYRGDLAFHNAEVIDVPQFLVEGVTQGEPVQTNTELWDILSQRIEDEMADYMRRLDLRTRDELIQTADEIDAKFGYSTYLSNEGANTITITATDADGYSATRSWTVYYENGDITVTVSVEATTVGLGYLVSPTEVTVPGGTDAWSIVEKVLTENGYGISGSGSYLSALQRSGICSGFFIDPELMDLIVADGMDENGAGLDPQPFSMDSLGEFDFYRWSGWMYSYNGSYPGYGMNVCKPQDGSVIRVRYTLALGKDIGGFTSASGSYGVSSGNYYKEW